MNAPAEDRPVKFVAVWRQGTGTVVSCVLCARQNKVVEWAMFGPNMGEKTHASMLDHARKFHGGTRVDLR